METKLHDLSWSKCHLDRPAGCREHSLGIRCASNRSALLVRRISCRLEFGKRAPVRSSREWLTPFVKVRLRIDIVEHKKMEQDGSCSIE
jgi:hypothetical protein